MNVVFQRCLAAHGNGVRILEAEWWKPTDIVPLRRFLSYALVNRTRITRKRVRQTVVQDCEQSSPRVFRVYVNRSAAQCTECESSSPQARPAHNGDARRFEQVRHHLGEHI